MTLLTEYDAEANEERNEDDGGTGEDDRTGLDSIPEVGRPLKLELALKLAVGTTLVLALREDAAPRPELDATPAAECEVTTERDIVSEPERELPAGVDTITELENTLGDTALKLTLGDATLEPTRVRELDTP